MRILNVIDHILDKDSGNVVLSQKEIAKDNLEISKYVEKVIDKFEKSEYVELELSRVPMLEQFWNGRDDFQKLTEKFALDYFDSIKVNEKIPGGDLLFFNVELEDLSQVIGIAKLDYTQRYIHNVEYDEDVLVNNIVQNNSILPSPSQGIKNMLLIDGDKVPHQQPLTKSPKNPCPTKKEASRVFTTEHTATSFKINFQAILTTLDKS